MLRYFNHLECISEGKLPSPEIRIATLEYMNTGTKKLDQGAVDVLILL